MLTGSHITPPGSSARYSGWVSRTQRRGTFRQSGMTNGDGDLDSPHTSTFHVKHQRHSPQAQCELLSSKHWRFGGVPDNLNPLRAMPGSATPWAIPRLLPCSVEGLVRIDQPSIEEVLVLKSATKLSEIGDSPPVLTTDRNSLSLVFSCAPTVERKLLAVPARFPQSKRNTHPLNIRRGIGRGRHSQRKSRC